MSNIAVSSTLGGRIGAVGGPLGAIAGAATAACAANAECRKEVKDLGFRILEQPMRTAVFLLTHSSNLFPTHLYNGGVPPIGGVRPGGLEPTRKGTTGTGGRGLGAGASKGPKIGSGAPPADIVRLSPESTGTGGTPPEEPKVTDPMPLVYRVFGIGGAITFVAAVSAIIKNNTDWSAEKILEEDHRKIQSLPPNVKKSSKALIELADKYYYDKDYPVKGKSEYIHNSIMPLIKVNMDLIKFDPNIINLYCRDTVNYAIKAQPYNPYPELINAKEYKTALEKYLRR
jgi:hypothetical protein